MRASRLQIIVLAASVAAAAWGQREPNMGYLYPAGGQQGTTFSVLAGGQNLRNPESVIVSGEGVSAEVVEWAPKLRGNNRGILTRHLRALIKFRTAQLAAKNGKGDPPDAEKLKEERAKLDELPDHPLARGLDEMSLVELLDLQSSLYDPKEQPNTQLGETVYLRVTISPDASPGDRELRLISRAGMTNPMVFQVGLLPEVSEEEPNDPGPPKTPRIDAMRTKPEPVELPVLMNGQIMPGDVDRFSFVAEQGQKLVVQVHARHLVPYLADAVPGWFQATVALFDSQGEELAYADEYLFSPDPVLYYQIPAGGEYQLEIRDAIYRGREDFVYRVSIGEQPFIRWIYPLGGNSDGQTTAAVGGWHLPTDEVKLGTEGMPQCIRQAQWPTDAGLCNHVLYAVDDVEEIVELEPNDSPADSQMIVPPLIINGRIDQPGDVDWFSFEGRAGEEIVAEVYARRLNSPVDAIVRLYDAAGRVLEWNDDHVEKDGHLHTGPGLLTHYADSLLQVTLPEDGEYFFVMADAQRQGGEEWGYRLHLTPPRPDFELKVAPASITFEAGRSAAAWVHVKRRGGFDGPVEVGLLDPPPGITLDGGWVPGGQQQVRVTLTASDTVEPQVMDLRFVGYAQIDKDVIARDAVPAENQMQAFLWRHLVPAQSFVANVTRRRGYIPTFEVACDLPLMIPRGGSVELPLMVLGKMPEGATPHITLSEAPDEIALREVAHEDGGLTVVLAAEGDALAVGYEDNLILNVEVEFNRTDNDGNQRTWRTPLGTLRAIPFTVIRDASARAQASQR
ncbi:MAG: hypothetical protein ACQER1_14865 [Armatimonadota bacterium]